MNRYVSRIVDEKGYITDMAEIIVEIGFLDSSVPGELNLEELSPIAREYLRDMLRTHIELLQEANKEYLK